MNEQMERQTISKIRAEIERLPLNIVESKAKKFDEAIEEAASAVISAGLYLVRGGSSPSGSCSYGRLYLQKTPNASHDHRHSDYKENVIDMWEWQTKGGGYVRPISARAIIEGLHQIERRAAEYNG